MRKVTIYAAMVTLAGVLAEIILRDTLVKTTLGIILCIVLSVITLIADYLAIDTAFEWILQNKKRELEQKKESEKKLYEILNNQIDVQNHIVDDLKQLQDRVDDIVLDRTVSALEPEEKGLSEEDHTKITKEINDYTIKTAKVIVKYVERGMQDLKKSIDALK